MKQKYSILKDADHRQLIIREFAELDKDALSLLCEESYANPVIESAISAGKDTLISALRTKNLYPPSIYAEKIADAVVDLFQSEDKESVDLFFNDIELLTKEYEAAEISAQVEDESENLDNLLEDDFDDDFEEKDDIDKIDSSIKIADDDYVDIDDES